MKVGDFVSTPYGEAKLTMYRETDKIYTLRLPYGMIYANEELIQEAQQKQQQATEEEMQAKKAKRAMEMNEAYESFEKMRRFNLEVTCQEHGIPAEQIEYEECTACLLEGALAARANTVAGRMSGLFRPKSASISDKMPRLKSFVAKREEQRKPNRCLTCGAPTCAKHSSAVFRREGITVCQSCEAIFQMDFLVDCLTLPPKERQAKVDKLIELYDRALVLLQFSSQYIDDVVEALRDTKKRHNHINAGGSSVGIVSGVLGVAAAATIVTPAGVPLLIASLVLGSTATAAQTGTDVANKFFSEPNKVADRILATHGMLLSVLTVAGTLRDAATQDHIRTDVFEEDSPVLLELQKSRIKNRDVLLAGMTAGRVSLASAELLGLAEGATIARSARLFSRSGTAAMRTLRFARVAGGALAAATLLLEAGSMTQTVQSIRNGSPCEKADALEAILEDMDNLPRTASLDRECAAYLAYMNQRGRRMMEEEAVQLLLEVSKTAEEEQKQKEEEEEKKRQEEEQKNGTAGQLILAEDTTNSADETATVSSLSSLKLSGSLLQRIQLHKEVSTASTAQQEQQPQEQEPQEQQQDIFADAPTPPRAHLKQQLLRQQQQLQQEDANQGGEPTIVIPSATNYNGEAPQPTPTIVQLPPPPPQEEGPPKHVQIDEDDYEKVVNDDDWSTLSMSTAGSTLLERIEEFKRRESS